MHRTLQEVSTPRNESPIGVKISIYTYIFETVGFLLPLFLRHLQTTLSRRRKPQGLALSPARVVKIGRTRRYNGYGLSSASGQDPAPVGWQSHSIRAANWQSQQVLRDDDASYKRPAYPPCGSARINSDGATIGSWWDDRHHHVRFTALRQFPPSTARR